MFDNICKFIAEEFSLDIATWLLGEPISFVALSPKELSVDPIRTDSLILRQSPDLILHAEFQTQVDAEIPFRMADYRLRSYRRFRDRPMRQIVVYLTKTRSPLVYQNVFEITGLRHEFEVIRLWEQPTAVFLTAPGLFPFAILSQTEAKEDVLREVARRVDEIPNRRIQSNIAASTSILAGLVLGQELIAQILRRDIMRESVVYQQLIREGKEEGRQEGRQEGIQQVARNLLTNGMSLEQVSGFTGLSIAQLQELPENPE